MVCGSRTEGGGGEKVGWGRELGDGGWGMEGWEGREREKGKREKNRGEGRRRRRDLDLPEPEMSPKDVPGGERYVHTSILFISGEATQFIGS